MRASDIITRLSAYLNKPVIFTNQSAPRPPYPYIGINEIVQYSPTSGYVEYEPLPEDINQIYVSQSTFTLSVTAYGKDFAGTIELAEKAHGWFQFVGKRDLKPEGYVVVNLGDITNRDTLLVDDYERRRGFDVQIRFTDRRERFLEEIKQVSGTVNNNPFKAEKE